MGITAFTGLMVVVSFLAGLFLLWVAVYTAFVDNDPNERTPIPPRCRAGA
ncbi:MAG: hypothetical protein M3354_11195 [Chloroflexota bacterium]|nr:hypothetical protein [Chloroflexota bacterium]